MLHQSAELERSTSGWKIIGSVSTLCTRVEVILGKTLNPTLLVIGWCQWQRSSHECVNVSVHGTVTIQHFGPFRKVVMCYISMQGDTTIRTHTCTPWDDLESPINL